MSCLLTMRFTARDGRVRANWCALRSLSRTYWTLRLRLRFLNISSRPSFVLELTARRGFGSSFVGVETLMTSVATAVSVRSSSIDCYPGVDSGTGVAGSGAILLRMLHRQHKRRAIMIGPSSRQHKRRAIMIGPSSRPLANAHALRIGPDIDSHFACAQWRETKARQRTVNKSMRSRHHPITIAELVKGWSGGSNSAMTSSR